MKELRELSIIEMGLTIVGLPSKALAKPPPAFPRTVTENLEVQCCPEASNMIMQSGGPFPAVSLWS
jgi:hypothetical protein